LHPAKDFVCEVGLETVKSPPRDKELDSAFARNRNASIPAFQDELNDDIPFS
jgi:hypothetical protein